MSHLSIRKMADKRQPREPILDDEGNEIGLKPYPLARVLVTEPPPFDHVMSWQYVDEARAEGWIVILDDVLEIRASNETVRYHIVEPPGRYNDSTTPDGYRIENQYTLQLISPR